MTLCADWILPEQENIMSSEVKVRLAILASGGGSNADQICRYFHQHPEIAIGAIMTNNPKAGVRHIAELHRIPFYFVPKMNWREEGEVLSILKQHHITHIILAGFLLLIPEWLLRAYPQRIVNIHPALLPKYGGKGMYGHHVHEAVKKAGDARSGITIHIIDEHYDEGEILFQKIVDLMPEDTPDQIGAKVLVAEHYYYPRVIEQWVKRQSMEIKP
jgi:phosphoribosylglycinamide formyltransferase-1